MSISKILVALAFVCFAIACVRLFLKRNLRLDLTAGGLALLALAMLLWPRPEPPTPPEPTPTPAPSPTPSPILETAYYIAPNGNDSRSCAEALNSATPKKTFLSAVACLKPGETLIAAAGTYNETDQIGNIPGGESWDRPVTVRAAPGATVILRAVAGDPPLFFNTPSQRFIIIDGLTIENEANGLANPVLWHPNVKVTSGSHHIRFINCEVRISPGSGFLLTGKEEGSCCTEILNTKIHDVGRGTLDHGTYISHDNVLVEDCDIYASTGYGVHIYSAGAEATIVRRNRLHNHGNAGVILGTGFKHQVYNNLIYDNGNAGVYIAGGQGDIVNNTIAWTGQGEGNYKGIEINSSALGVCRIENNIITQSRTWGIEIYPDNTWAHVIRSNLATANDRNKVSVPDIEDKSGKCQLEGNLVGSSQVVAFTNPSQADFSILANSSAKDRGRASNLKDDFLSNPRPVGAAADIGGYEYTTAPTKSKKR